jgi:tRNA(Ile)-lysidine synthetase-like protein
VHVARLCERLGVELITERRIEDVPKGSLQAGARALRYAFLERAAARVGAASIALGHTADDAVEGVVLHLLRGCGVAGLRGMPARRGIFVRPLLGTWRREIDEFLRERSLAPLLDPANEDRRFARVRVRRDLLPELERSRPGIIRRLHAVAMSAAELQEQIVEAAERTLQAGGVDGDALHGLPQPVAAEALRILYRRAGGPAPGLSRGHIDAMLALAGSRGRGGRGLDLPGGLRFRALGSRVEVVPGVPPFMEATLETRPCTGCDAAGALHLKTGVELRLTRRRPGMRIQLRRGTRKLQDVFVDARVPREDRDGWPLVMAGDTLVWVPGVAADDRLRARPGEASQHVTVTRMLAESQKTPMLKSANSPRGESS